METSDIIRKLCKENHISVTDLESKLGFSTGSLTKGSSLRSDRLYEVAKYFNVSMEYLLHGEEHKAVEFLRNQNVVKLSDEAIDIAEQYSASAPEVQEMIRMLLKYSEHQS